MHYVTHSIDDSFDNHRSSFWVFDIVHGRRSMRNKWSSLCDLFQGKCQQAHRVLAGYIPLPEFLVFIPFEVSISRTPCLAGLHDGVKADLGADSTRRENR